MPDLPFLTRSHLDFEKSATFSLVLTEQGGNGFSLLITGATKSGPFSYKHVMTSSATPVLTTFNLPDVPLFVSVSSADEYLNPGDCYISLALHINQTKCQVLCGGYLNYTRPLTWPVGDIQPSLPSLVSPVQIASSNPAAGSEISMTPALYTAWKLIAFRVRLVTSATVANRRVHFVIRSGSSGTELDFVSSVDQAASTTRDYTIAPVGALGAYSDDNDIIIPIPDDLIINYADTIKTITTNIQAGDNFDAASARVERYFVNANT